MSTATDSEAAQDSSARAEPLANRLWRWRVAVLVGAVFLVALMLAWRGRPGVLYDDAAITMRYAWRIVNGLGWTYNDGDATNGASAPLYTMVLAALHAVGFDLPSAARLFGVFCYASAVALATLLAERIAGVVAAVLTAVILLSWYDFLTQSLSGMESAFAVVLGLATILALREGRDGLAGAILALALINKLDAGLLAAALGVAYLVVMRRPPWRVMGFCIVVFTPWLVFATAYFGSVLPYSFTQKASSQVVNPAADLTSMWIIDSLRAQSVVAVVVVALGAVAVVPWLARRSRRAALALAVCVAWPVAHALAFSLIPLGDVYPWYLTALYAPLSIAAACVIAALVQLAMAATSWRRVALAGVTVVVLAFALGSTASPAGRVVVVADTIRYGSPAGGFQAAEAARREAAIYLSRVVQPGDTIETCFGWFAYESPTNQIKETCPLNTRDPVGRPQWGTFVAMPSTVAPQLPYNATVVATFISATDPATEPSMRVDVVAYSYDD